MAVIHLFGICNELLFVLVLCVITILILNLKIGVFSRSDQVINLISVVHWLDNAYTASEGGMMWCFLNYLIKVKQAEML